MARTHAPANQRSTTYTPPTRSLVGLCGTLGAAFGAVLGNAVGFLDWQSMPADQALANGVVGGTLVGVVTLLAGRLLDSLEFRGHLRRNRLVKAAVIGGAISALPGLCYVPLLPLVVPVGTLCAWLAALWSAPLPPFPSEQFLPLRRRWAWYFLTASLAALAPILALGSYWLLWVQPTK